MIPLRISFLWRQKMFVPGWHVDTTWLRILYTYIYIYFLPFKRLCLLGTCCTLYPNLLEPYSVGQLLALQRVFRLNTFLDRLSFIDLKFIWVPYQYERNIIIINFFVWLLCLFAPPGHIDTLFLVGALYPEPPHPNTQILSSQFAQSVDCRLVQAYKTPNSCGESLLVTSSESGLSPLDRVCMP